MKATVFTNGHLCGGDGVYSGCDSIASFGGRIVCIGAVSYTHLDVYKRQRKDCAHISCHQKAGRHSGAFSKSGPKGRPNRGFDSTKDICPFLPGRGSDGKMCIRDRI